MTWGNVCLSADDLVQPSQPVEYRAYADVDFSPAALDAEQKRVFALDALDRLPAIAVELGWCQMVKSFSLGRAAAFIANLPTNRHLPKIAADDEGDILFRWDSPTGGVGLTIEGFRLHLSINPGAHSTHVGPVIYSGSVIPPSILAEIPRRD